jgi:phosphoenolpyruvate-protein phosphotransferase (PTS system enzyme I)
MCAALAAGAEGVGLFRTEFLFLDDSATAPSEEKQVEAYRKVLEAFPDKRVVIRVLDAGAGCTASRPHWPRPPRNCRCSPR